MKQRKWESEVIKGSTVELEKETQFETIGTPNTCTIPPGKYYVCGFWPLVVGLSKTKDSLNDYVIPSIELKKFKDII